MSFPIEEYIPALSELCREYGVIKLEVFGSACTEEFNPDRSDIDFLVEFPAGYDFGSWLSSVQNLESALSAVIGKNADLVMISAVKNRWF